jgi:CSLREA domain-containing protein
LSSDGRVSARGLALGSLLDPAARPRSFFAYRFSPFVLRPLPRNYYSAGHGTYILIFVVILEARIMAHRKASRRTARRTQRTRNHSQSSSSSARRSLYHRKLRLEPLEDRRLLTVVTVTTVADTVDVNDGLTSLREAIFAANTVPGADTIQFDPSLTAGGPAKILLTQGDLKITSSLTINGPGASLLTIDASGNDPTPNDNFGDGSRVFSIDDGNAGTQQTVSITGLTLTGGDVMGGGGAIFSRENLSVVASTISGNTSNVGGAVYAVTGANGQIQILSCAILNNLSHWYGGGIQVSNGPGGATTIADCTIAYNRAQGAGGGIDVTNGMGGTSTISGNTIVGNNTSGTVAYGGGLRTINAKQGTILIDNNVLMGNTTSGTIVSGGGLFLQNASAGTISIASSTISNNSTHGTQASGGGLYIRNISDGTVTIDNAFVAGNTTQGTVALGGGMSLNYGSFTVNDSTITGNSAGSSKGQGISFSHTFPNSVLTINGTAIRNNSPNHPFASALAADGGKLALSDTTIEGNGGIGIVVTGTTTIENSTIRGNRGMGIVVSGTTSITDSFITDNAGGISATGGVVTINNSSISDNVSNGSVGGIQTTGSFVTIQSSTIDGNSNAQNGGGIAVAGGSLSVSTSTIRDNTTLGSGGGVFANSFIAVDSSTINGNSAGVAGGGISSSLATRISSSTISGNSANRGGGVNVADGQLTIDHSTITANTAADGQGSGIASQANALTHAVITYSIVAGNTRSDLDFVAGLINSFQSQDYNVVGTGSGAVAFTQPGDQSGVLDPLLAPLADNGGPTMTHALLQGSPAINRGSLNALFEGTPLFDQRGQPFSRIFGGRIDIGAFELQKSSDLHLLVDTLADESNGNYGRGDLSLREAIELANTFPGGDSINFDDSLRGGTILLNSGLPQITDGLVINGPGADLLTIDGRNGGFFGTIYAAPLVFPYSTPSAFALEVSALTIANSNTTGIAALGADLTIRDSTIIGSRQGGIASGYGSLKVTSSQITGNFRTNPGGLLRQFAAGVSAAYGDVSLVDTTISNNSSNSQGGGISLYFTSSASIVACSIVGNSASYGGGIFTRADTPLSISGSTISSNTAVLQGGGLYTHRNPFVSITSSLLNGNHAGQGGGAVSSGSPFFVTDSVISGNTAGTFGGGILAFSPTTIVATSVIGNSAGHDGGGINAYRVALDSSTISGNSAIGNGGGIWVGANFSSATPHTTITRSTIAFNTAGSSGGGLFATTGTAALDNSIVARNSALSGPDLTGLIGTAFDAHFTLVGSNGQSGFAESPGDSPDGNGNHIGRFFDPINPRLGPLVNNGGPTLPDGSSPKTHALLPGSPAINAGDPAAVAGMNGVPQYDQRGTPWYRVSGGRIDIGAIEFQPNPLPGDYNLNGIVDAADYSLWRDTLDSITDLRADGNGDGMVNQADYNVWRTNFGATLPVGASGAGAATALAEPMTLELGQAEGGIRATTLYIAPDNPASKPASDSSIRRETLSALARQDLLLESWSMTRRDGRRQHNEWTDYLRNHGAKTEAPPSDVASVLDNAFALLGTVVEE